MKIWTSIKSLGQRVWNWLSHYEAADTSTLRGNQGAWWRRGNVPDPNEVNRPEDRLEVIRVSQDLERNNSLAKRLGTIFVTYTVGGGLPIKPASSDAEWNKVRQERWDRFCKSPDLTSDQDFDSFQVLCAWRTFYDGAGYILKTREDRRPYFPRVQYIEAANVRTPPTLSDRKNIFDGKETDTRGKVVAYHIREVVNGEERYRRYSANDIIPICDFNRPGELHSFSYLTNVLNDIRDLDELAKLGMDKAKEAAETKNVYKTENRELPEAEAMRQAKVAGTRTLKDGTQITKDKVQMLDERFGGKNIAIGINEDVSQLGAGTPNEIEQAHWKIIAARICAGTNIPMMFVFPESVQGTVARFVVDDFATYCKSQSKIFQKAFLEIYRFATQEEMAMDPKLGDVPRGFDWWRASIRPPRAPNADIGHNMRALISALQVGGATLDDFYVPLGLDTEDQLERGFQILAKINALSEKYTVPVGQFSKALGDAALAELEAEENSKREEESKAVQTA